MSDNATTQQVLDAKENNDTSLSLNDRELQKLPDQITELTQLETLTLQSNYLEEFPRQLWELKNLKTLHLGFNYISKIPSEICCLTNLEHLFLGYNLIQELPSELALLSKLQTLHINNNQLSRIPIQIAQLPELEELMVTMNQIESPPIHIANKGIDEIREWFGISRKTSKSGTISSFSEDSRIQSRSSYPVKESIRAVPHSESEPAKRAAERPSLDQLAVKFGTDKGSKHGNRPGLDYCNQYYEPIMKPYRDRPVKLLEIGIKQGDSLRMWQEYFSEAEVYGLDINPQAMITNQERITTFCGDQRDTVFLDQIANEHGPFDFIIDDGGHWAEHQLSSLQSLSQHVRKVYFIEDLWNGHVHGGDALFRALSSELSMIVYGESSNWRSVHLHPHFMALEK